MSYLSTSLSDTQQKMNKTQGWREQELPKKNHIQYLNFLYNFEQILELLQQLRLEFSWQTEMNWNKDILLTNCKIADKYLIFEN